MMTPERALELAAKIEPSSDGATVPTVAESAEIAAALHHYAAMRFEDPSAYLVECDGSVVVLQTKNVVKGFLGGRKGVVKELIVRGEVDHD